MIRGSITALVTPFKGGVVDETAFQDFIEWQIESGTHGLVPCGTTGESATLSDMEHKRVIELCVEAANGRVPVIAGAGSNETSVSIEYTNKAKSVGADAVLVVTPYYNRPSQEGIFQHFKAISDSVDIPIIVYNIPARSVVDITNDTMGRLATLDNVVGCKDATGEISRVAAIYERCGKGFIQLSGDDPSSLGHTAHGGKGCISVGSNVAPKAYAQFHELMWNNKFDEAMVLNRLLHRLHQDLFVDPSPAPAKYALNLLGKMNPDVRLPITAVQDSNKELILSAIRRAGINI
ncbi:4-hydroxy-tetrahydrodipicolinate synthase [Hellea sp.]|jgi:4-hydroxy-tetrahydrodipicolinate synthase|nr:4-hydroxy-tetrahydrodipicolinate synthase [Hellea sp.]MDB4844537.1 4-hydroxy-tetrahydrodipicolinate synthase [Hellea sp.]MDC1062117.1 4-hydroxy-tetrahydrodipicolinate synthase [Hellea sp.]MDC1089475.1 4-hydroxy-tetrahydrodipicolinate synthase [Hellea sp.]